jgi:hypothetical protein
VNPSTSRAPCAPSVPRVASSSTPPPGEGGTKGIGQNLANANAGITAFATASLKQQNQRIIAQNDQMISLLQQQLLALDFLARMKKADIEARA